MQPVLLIHHAARRSGRHPASSLAALADCLDAGAAIVEVDITPLADGDFALAHDELLETFSDGRGPAAAATAAQVRRLRYRERSRLSDERVGTLSEAVALVGRYPRLVELQLDLKPHAPLTAAVLAGLVRLVAPVRRQVRITSPADWAIRRLAQDPQAPALGFDPLLYLDLERGEGGTAPPLRIGAYGYLDEHPLALRVWGAPADYLAARAEALWAQAPASMWYIRAALLARALDDGFDWIAWLRQRGASVTAWTFTPAHPHHIALAQQLVAAGAARLTTTDAPGLAAALGGQAVWGG